MTKTLVVDIGNSAATVALLDLEVSAEPTIQRSFLHVGDEGARFEAHLCSLVREVPVARVAIAEVNATASARAVEALASSHRVFVAPRDFQVTIENRCDPPQSVGQDRLFNAEALPRDRAFVVIDAGTAITVDLVDRGRFLGGAIAPGIRMSYEALHRRTDRLPLLEPSASPPRALGTATVAALAAGVEVGTAGLVDRLVADIGRSYDALILITGGDAARLLPLLRCNPIHDSTLTLRGIAWALERSLARLRS